jgi:hypothetical protein
MNQQAVFNFLNEAYEILQNTENVSMSLLIRKHKLGTYILPVLIDGGILKKIKKAQYKWSSIPPNMKMAEKVIQETRKKNKLIMYKYFEKPETNEIIDPFEDGEVFEISDISDIEEPKHIGIDIGEYQVISNDEFQAWKNTLKEKEDIIEILKNEKASLLESMDSNYEAYQKQISELESNLKRVAEYNQNLGEECVGLKFKMEAYEQELLSLKNLKSQILKDCNIQETKFKEKTTLYENLIDKQQEKIDLLEDKLNLKKYKRFTNLDHEFEKEKVSKEFSLLWGVIKIKR